MHTTITLFNLLITTNSIGQSHVWQLNLYFPLSKFDIDCLCFIVVKLDCVFGADLDMYEIVTVSEVRCILSLSFYITVTAAIFWKKSRHTTFVP